jgi:hypothetical protein
MQDLKEKLLEQSREQMDEAECKMILRINQEMTKFNEHFEGVRGKLYKKIDELQIFVNDCKDE